MVGICSINRLKKKASFGGFLLILLSRWTKVGDILKNRLFLALKTYVHLLIFLCAIERREHRVALYI